MRRRTPKGFFSLFKLVGSKYFGVRVNDVFNLKERASSMLFEFQCHYRTLFIDVKKKTFKVVGDCWKRRAFLKDFRF